MTVVRSVAFSKQKLAMKAVLFIGLVVLLEYGICFPFVWTNFSDTSKGVVVGEREGKSEAAKTMKTPAWNRAYTYQEALSQGDGAAYSSKFYAGKLRPEIQSLPLYIPFLTD